jgi:hypothetical protein
MKIPYHQMEESNKLDLVEKLEVAQGWADTFSLSVRPGLQKANEYWHGEVERLSARISSLFEI